MKCAKNLFYSNDLSNNLYAFCRIRNYYIEIISSVNATKSSMRSLLTKISLMWQVQALYSS